MLWRLTRVASSIVVLISALINVQAHAASERECNAYVRSALQDVRYNVRLRCGFRGPRWSGRRTGHMNWCIDARGSSLADEALVRRRMLGECYCRRYADAAVSQQAKNRRMRCRYSGTRWHANHGGHYSWCLGHARSFDPKRVPLFGRFGTTAIYERTDSIPASHHRFRVRMLRSCGR